MKTKQTTSQRNNAVHSVDCYPEYKYISCISNTNHTLRSPLSQREGINCESIDISTFPACTNRLMQPNQAILHLRTHHSTAMNLYAPCICETPENSDTVFRLKHMGSTSHEDTSERGIIVRSQQINSDECSILDLEDNFLIGNESLLQENCDEGSVKAQQLFDNSRLLPTPFGKGTILIL